MLDLRGELLTPAQVAQLLDGTLDLGLLRPPVHDRELSTEVLRSEPLVAVLPESHPLAAEDAVQLEMLARRAVRHLPVALPLGRARRRRGRVRRPRLQAVAAHEVAETATLVSFVAAGLGVSLVPASVDNMTVQGAVYRPLAEDTTRVELAVAWRRDDERPVLVRALDVIRRLEPT